MEINMEIAKNSSLPLRDVAFETLRESIIKGRLKPGERLFEERLAARLGMSRTPVREAIRKLELEGLVVMEPRKGAVVSAITEKNLLDVLDVRKALEELAVKLACKKMTPEIADELKDAEDDFERADETGDLSGMADADIRFHDIIYRSTGNTRLMQLLSNLFEQMYRFRVEYLKIEGSGKTLSKEHRDIMDALAAGDTGRAADAVCLHIDHQVRAVLSAIRESSEDSGNTHDGISR